MNEEKEGLHTKKSYRTKQRLNYIYYNVSDKIRTFYTTSIFVFSGANDMLNVQGPSVEKGLSASTYFDQFGSGTESTAGGDDNANSSVFEAFAQSDTAAATNPTDAQIADQAAVATVTDETIEWYKTQLEQYQQAINDWQIWSQSQMDEVAKLKVCTY